MPTDLLAGTKAKKQPVDLLAQQPAAATPQEPGETSLVGLASNLGGGFNTGLAQVLGLPVDIVNSALARVSGGPEATSFAETAQGLKGQLGGQIGEVVRAGEPEAAPRPQFDQALGSGQQLAGLLEGTPLEGRAPQTGVERITRRVGEELGATAVPFGAAGAAARGGQAASTVGRALTEGFRQAPGAVAATEAGLASTAGLGAGVAQEIAPGSQGAEIAGQLIGGIAPIAAIGAVRGTISGVKSKLRPTSRQGVEREVAEQLQTASTDPNRAVANLEAAQAQAARTPGFELETGQAVNDAGISALQKRRMQVSPALQGRVEEMRANSNQALRASLDQIAPTNEAGVIEFQQGVRQSVDGMLGALDKRIADATKLADDQARLLGTGRSQAEASDVVRDELQNAADAFLEADRAIFGKVDPFNSLGSPVDKITASIKGIRSSRSPAEAAANFPSDIVQAFGKIAPRNVTPASTILGPTGAPARAAQALPREASFKDLRAFRSRILDEIRQEKARVPSNLRRIGNMTKIRESVDATLDDIAAGTTGGDPQAVERLRAANAFHAQGVDKFRKGPVGKVLRKSSLGEDAVARSATIGEFFRSGKGARESVDALTRTLGENAVPAVEDFVADEIFAKTVGTNGRVDPQRLQRWMTQNRQPLSQFPSIRQKLGNVANAERLVAERVGLKARSAADVEKGALGLVLNRDPETVTKGLLASGDATKRVRELRSLVKGNPKAQAGLKRAIWDNMTDQFERGPLAKRRDVAGSPFLRPESMQDFIKRHANTLKEAGYTPAEIKNLRVISENAELARRGASTGLPRPEAAGQPVLALNQLLSRFYGIARGVVSPRFVASEVGSRVVNRFIKNLSEERISTLLDSALVDPDLARTLLLKPTAENAPKIVNRLGSFLAGTGSTAAQIAQPEPAQ